MSGLFLRLFMITKRDLWFDELLSNSFTYQTVFFKTGWFRFTNIFYFLWRLKKDPVSILYGFLVYCYSFFFGGWESLRYLSLAASVLSLFVLYRLSRLFLNKKESACAVLLMAVNPFQIWYAQEARGYALSCLVSMLTVYVFIKALRKGKLFYWITFCIAGIAGLYSSYFSFYTIIISGIIILLLKEKRGLIKKWLFYASIIIVSFLPFFIIFLRQISYIHTYFWLKPPGLLSLPLTFGVISLGYSSNISGLIIGSLLFIALFIFGSYSCYKDCKDNGRALLLFFLPPIILTYIVSRVITPIYLDRQFIIFTPFYFILLAKGLMKIRNRIYKSAAIAAILLLTASSLYNYYNKGYVFSCGDGTDFYQGVHSKKNYTKEMNFMLSNLKDKDIICTTDVQSYVITYAYLERHRKDLLPKIHYFLFYPSILEHYQIKYLSLTKIREEIFKDKEDKLFFLWQRSGRAIIQEAGDFNAFGRAWVLSSTWNPTGNLSSNSSKVRGFFQDKYKNYYKSASEGIFMDLYLIKA